MRFEEAYWAWQDGRFSQEEAARLLGVCERTFRRYLERFEEEGPTGLMDKRIGQISHRRAPVDEALALVELYRRGYPGWNVRHFHSWYRQDHGGTRSYTWAKLLLQAAGVVEKAPGRGKHRKRRERMALPGMLVHQDASRHEWIEGQHWDLVVTMDDATGEHTSMFFCEEEGTCSSLHGIGQTIGAKGLFCSLYTDRGSHYFHTPQAAGAVDRTSLTQVGRALQQLGIEHIAAYSPEARGRSERAFGTHQERLPRELAKAAITDTAGANAYLQQGVPAAAQRRVQRTGQRNRKRLRALYQRQPARYLVRTVQAQRGQRQLRELRGLEAADPGFGPAPQFRQDTRTGPSLR
jgi:hypothetical protein